MQLDSVRELKSVIQRKAVEMIARAAAAGRNIALSAQPIAGARATHRTFALGIAPRTTRDFRLAAPNAIHFHPPGGLLLPGQPRTTTMALSDRLVEHEYWQTARLLIDPAELALAERMYDDDLWSIAEELNVTTQVLTDYRAMLNTSPNRIKERFFNA